MEPQGTCLQERAQIVFPNGMIKEGSVWQHADGAKCIYAAIPFEEGNVFFALAPQWQVDSAEGRPVYQGMAPESSPKITWEVIQVEAERLGYEVSKPVGHILAVKKQSRHVGRAVSLTQKFLLDPLSTEQFALLRLYYWMKGFEIEYGVDGKVELFLSIRHPLFQEQVRQAEAFDYTNHWSFDQLTCDLAEWVAMVEESGGA